MDKDLTLMCSLLCGWQHITPLSILTVDLDDLLFTQTEDVTRGQHLGTGGPLFLLARSGS